jgi:hypothetical protein
MYLSPQSTCPTSAADPRFFFQPRIPDNLKLQGDDELHHLNRGEGLGGNFRKNPPLSSGGCHTFAVHFLYNDIKILLKSISATAKDIVAELGASSCPPAARDTDFTSCLYYSYVPNVTLMYV